LRPFDEVSAEIVKRLTDEQAARLAAKQGAEMLAKLQRGEADPSLTWDTPRVVERQRAEGFDEATLRQAFRADASKLPAYAGIEGAGGYTLIKVGKVIDPESIAPEKRKAVAAQLEQLIGQEMLRAYLANLKRKAEVKVKLELVERKDR